MENYKSVCLMALASTIFAHGVGSFFFPRELPMAWQSVDSIATKCSQVSFSDRLIPFCFVRNGLTNWESIGRQFYCVWFVMIPSIVPISVHLSFLNQLKIL